MAVLNYEEYYPDKSNVTILIFLDMNKMKTEHLKSQVENSETLNNMF